jgi:predicted short-subunit dehydrogenase-like oxidoreductase (DUF2520 family)
MRELERDTEPSEPERAPLAIVGAGRVGRAIERAAAGAGIDARVAGRRSAVDSCRATRAALLCVPDAEIEAACEVISPAVPPLELVGHTSGATGLAALEAARLRGAATFSLHPLQTVPDGDASLTGAPCAIAGSDPGAERYARRLAVALGMTPFDVPEEARAAYHAAASISSNFLVTLQETAAELLERAGIEEGRELLVPLVLRTAANWAERGPDALTGPIARGDEATVERQLAAIEACAPALADVYRTLAERTRALAAQRAETRS